MTASIGQRERIAEKLPHELLQKLYLNSRVSIKQLEKELGISSHTISKILQECENKYGLVYTLDINTSILGFSEPRIIAVKFEEKVPDIKLLKRVLSKDLFVQNAYLATGDFDLILHIIATNRNEYNLWLYRFRMGFCHYKPRVKVSTIDYLVDGSLPLRGALIKRSKEINASEKKLLLSLINDARRRVTDVSKDTKLSQMMVIYLMNKLVKKGIIRKFTTYIQTPEKRLFLFYAVTDIPNEDHHPKSLLKFLDKIIGEESSTEVTNDYAVVLETSGQFDTMFNSCSLKTSFLAVPHNLSNSLIYSPIKCFIYLIYSIF